jgi:hypothetical protein
VKSLRIVGVVALTSAAILMGLWHARRVRVAVLSPDELTRKVRTPAGPRRITEGCPEVAQVRALFSSSSSSVRKVTIKSEAPLEEHQVAIYRAVLEQYAANERTSLNVSTKTFPLDLTFQSRGASDCGCWEGVDIESLSAATHAFHDLPSQALPDKYARLVDAKRQSAIVRANDPERTIGGRTPAKDAVKNALATGLFSMSEIAFDREHHLAWVSYSFWCGSLCGNGSTLVFEKIGTEWKKANRSCGGWIS